VRNDASGNTTGRTEARVLVASRPRRIPTVPQKMPYANHQQVRPDRLSKALAPLVCFGSHAKSSLWSEVN
jgi:hypothetical protein